MKTLKFIVLTLAITSMSFNRPYAGLTDAERQNATQILQDSKNALVRTVAGLTPEQLNFKPSADCWSISECVEHLAIAENNFTMFVQQSLKTAADPSKRSEVKMTDDAVIKMITDRTTKVKTTEMFQPSGKFGSYESTIAEFKSKRDNNINYIKTTTDDLRNYYNDFPFGKIDAYQTILFMAGHSKRHTEQIREIMRDVKFPKK